MIRRKKVILLNLDEIKNALLEVGVPVSRYSAVEQPDKYIVWAEDNQAAALWADGKMVSQAVEGTIDYYTKMENDPNVDKIQSELNDGNISWRLNSVQFENDTGFIHYEWVWQIWLG